MDPTLSDILDRLLDEEILVPCMMCLVGITAIVCGTLSSAIKSVARERTRREIAAYLAEGSLTAEQAERILKAKNPDRCC
ncbi:MAG: hypothetical protein KF912_13240 [Phycisphaeraceae bacterium]|nr:hypothetical protein [Phycisphaeraceae bacterium]MBX3368270.1 hypothetical protein [Phycisphaeraceae bacterium]QYK47974.1 MAG: hypothetical protein KF838_14435 [Phycisphaeraceae bacterium]